MILKYYPVLSFIYALIRSHFLHLLITTVLNVSGFISLDCGLPINKSYSEPTTIGLNYISDGPFIKTGVSKTIAPEYKARSQEQVAYLRSFPEGIRTVTLLTLQREQDICSGPHSYTDYDGQNIAPKFDLHLGANFWDTVGFVNVSVNTIKEIIHVSLQDYVRICLVNTGSGTPFISALEFRPLLNNTYVIPSGSLMLSLRVDIGRSINDIRTYR